MSSELEKLRKKLGLGAETVKNSTQKTSSKSGTKASNTTRTTSTTSHLDQLRNDLGLDDIAPVMTSVTNRMKTKAKDTVSKKKKEDEEEDKWYKGWFQKGALEDGIDLENISKSIIGTITDAGEDLLSGAVGSPEKLWKGAMKIAPAAYVGQQAQNSLNYQFDIDEYRKMQKASNELASKVEYDEQAIAQKVLSNLYGNGQNISKLQNGQMLTEEDLLQGQESAKVAKEYIDTHMEADSVFNVKSDRAMYSLGQQMVTRGMGKFIPWQVTSGLSTLGSEAESAKQEGATDDEATMSGLISAGGEILSEYMFGGFFGEVGLDDALIKDVSRRISSKFFRNALTTGIKGVGEALEEGFSWLIGNTGKWLTYADEKSLKEVLTSDEALDELWESMIAGGALGGAMSTYESAIAKASGVDYASGLVQSEEAVVRKVYDELVEEAKKDGKVTEREKRKIYDKVTRELEKGGISTDVIESLMDEEGYNAFIAEKDNFFNSDLKKSYDEAKLSEAAELDQLQKKLEELIDAPNTVGNNKLYDSVVSQITELTENPKSNAIKAQLDQEVKRINEMHNELRTKVHDMVKGTKLEESYNELIRSNQKYEVDVTKYTDPNARKTIENILKSGMGDNTTHFHEYADWLAQISADRGMSFSLTDNEALKGTEHDFSAEGLTTDGFITEDGVVLNMDSPKALNVTVGHEVTHALEQDAEFYQALQDAVFKYEVTKNGQEAFDKRLNDTIARYKGKDADAKKELTADLIGEYVFTDYDFVHNLSTENRNLFKKIYDEIKYLCKVVTAGSKEARELEKVKKVFEDAYRANVKAEKNTADSGVKYSVRKDIVDVNGKEYDSVVELDKTISKRTMSNPKQFLNYIEKNLVGLKIPVVDASGNVEIIEFARANETTSKNGKRHPVLGELGYTKGDTRKQVIVNAKEVIEESLYDPKYSSTNNDHGWLDENGWESRKTYVLTQDGNIFEAYLKIAKARDGRNILYAVNLDINNGIAVDKGATSKRAAVLAAMPSGGMVAQNGGSVKHSMSEEFSDMIDSDGVALTQAQKQYFGESGLKDDNGNLLKLYRSADGGRTVWDGRGEGSSAKGIYLTDDVYVARAFAVDGKKVGDVLEVYARANNPLIIDAQGSSYIDIPMPEDAPSWLVDSGDWEGRLNADQLPIDAFENGHDAVIIKNVREGVGGDPATDVILRDSNQMKRTDNTKPTDNPDIRYSLYDANGKPKQHGDWNVYGSDFGYKGDFAPTIPTPNRKSVLPGERHSVAEMFPDEPDTSQAEYDNLVEVKSALENRLQELSVSADFNDPEVVSEFEKLTAEWSEASTRLLELDAELSNTDRLDSLTDADAPPEMDAPYYESEPTALTKKATADIVRDVRASLSLTNPEMSDCKDIIERYRTGEIQSRDELIEALQDRFGTYKDTETNERLAEVKRAIRTTRINVSDTIKHGIADYAHVMRSNRGKILFAKNGLAVDEVYKELQEQFPDFFNEDADMNPEDQLRHIIEIANTPHIEEVQREKDIGNIAEAADLIINGIGDFKHNEKLNLSNRESKQAFESLVRQGDKYAPMDDIAPVKTQLTEESATPNASVDEDIAPYEDNGSQKRVTRKELHQGIVDKIKSIFKAKGFDFDEVLKKAKNLSTFATVDNIPQRVMEKSLGYKEGGILADITVNKVAQNESEGIKWLNSFTDRKNGLLAQLSKQYNIKPGSKESAAAQMYAEGFYVDGNNNIIQYGDAELAIDFKNPKVRENIKKLARDPRIRQVYDETLASINASRTRNAYPEIPRLDNYFLHFRAMEDTFSRLGLPFNPNDIRAKDLPTDLNGVTADLKPGQPYFASAMHREGKRTSFDLLGGLERYLTSAKNQIYHIDDIQTLRALRNYIADTYGQANGLEGLDVLSETEAEERIKQVYGSHLSTFAKFLNEEANVLAGKTALIDRGLEGIIGRRGITFLNTVNQQVGANMVGWNISSSLTNFLPVAQTFAKTNKFDFVKAFAQTVGNKVGAIVGKTDGFTENSPVVIRRKGADRFYRTPWQKLSDPGYAFMSAVDDISTELIARTKYNELTRKGMDSQQAHYETDKWVSRLMGDRSLGQMPQLYNSKMLGLVTKFQLEVRNQLDSQFYDTIQETKASNEDIQNGLLRNAKTAAKVTSTFVQLAVVQHLFGKAFESVAGYNPAFDIIEVLMTAFGFDDEEESEDTVLDNIEQGFFALLEDLPYASTFTGGGRIPISSALPIKELVKGEDQYGNEKSRWETLGEIAPYYVLPGGYGQIKKTVQGLGMFSDEHPIAGSYTDSGNLRFPVEDTTKNRVKAGIFGQYASENARKYFAEEQKTLNPEQTEILAGLDIPIEEYWEYRDNLNDFYDLKDELEAVADEDGATTEDILKSRYISSVSSDIYKMYEKQKEIASGDSKNKQSQLRELQEQMESMLSGSKSALDNVSTAGAYAEVGNRRYNYDAEKNTWYEIKPRNSDGSANWYFQMEQKVTKALGISYEEYWSNREEYNYAYEKPEQYAVAKAVGGYESYRSYSSDLYDIKADKDKNGKSISGSRKAKVIDYINNMNADYGEKIILFKSEYPADDTYNYEIIEYLNGRDDLSYQEMETILKELGFNVDSKGHITW